MAKVKVAVVVGSNRRDSINRKLAQALAGLAEGRLAFHFVSIEDLPLYNQDLEGELPQSVVRFKSEIAAADAVLFVTPEHNRSIPAVLKNAIDWGARPYGQNSWSGKPAAITGTSPGALGTAVAQLHLRQVLGTPAAITGMSWAGKPTSLLSRVCSTRTGPSPTRRRGDFSRLLSISSRRWSPDRRLLERQPPRRAISRGDGAVNTTNTLQEVKPSCPFGR
jgi:chromate reductase